MDKFTEKDKKFISLLKPDRTDGFEAFRRDAY